jgi:hypothetical protein
MNVVEKTLLPNHLAVLILRFMSLAVVQALLDGTRWQRIAASDIAGRKQGRAICMRVCRQPEGRGEEEAEDEGSVIRTCNRREKRKT